MSRVVGIDLGTTNSLVAYVEDGRPVVIRDKSSDALLPSVVTATDDGTIFVGREAQRRLLTEASRTVPVALALFPGVFEVPWADIAAASLLASVPPVVIVFALQRHLVRGLLAGALKE